MTNDVRSQYAALAKLLNDEKVFPDWQSGILYKSNDDESPFYLAVSDNDKWVVRNDDIIFGED